MEGAILGFTPGVAKLADGAPTVPQCFSPNFAFAFQGAVPVVSWPFAELGYLERSFRDEASFLAFLRLFNFWTRRPGTAEAVLRFYTHISYKKDPDRLFFTQSASETTPSSKGRVDCHRLRQSQCNRVPLLLLKAFCAVPLLSCQRLGTSQTRERMGTTLRLATRHHLPSAGLDVHLSDFSYGVSLRAWDGYPPFAFPRAAGPDLSSEQGADWVTVDLGSEEQANVFSHNTVSTLVRLHITSGYSR